MCGWRRWTGGEGRRKRRERRGMMRGRFEELIVGQMFDRWLERERRRGRGRERGGGEREREGERQRQRQKESERERAAP
jgi:hypothetical protein